jgi:hypothetical protein
MLPPVTACSNFQLPVNGALSFPEMGATFVSEVCIEESQLADVPARLKRPRFLSFELKGGMDWLGESIGKIERILRESEIIVRSKG